MAGIHYTLKNEKGGGYRSVSMSWADVRAVALDMAIKKLSSRLSNLRELTLLNLDIELNRHIQDMPIELRGEEEIIVTNWIAYASTAQKRLLLKEIKKRIGGSNAQ